MATDVLVASSEYGSSGTAWDDAADWSLGALPQSGDTAVLENLTYPDPAFSLEQGVYTSATDPAYIVASLTISSTQGVYLDLIIANSLTVLGPTTLGGPVTIEAGGTVQLDGTLNGDISNGGTLSVATISSGVITTGAQGVTSVGSATGATEIGIDGGTTTIGAFTSTVTFGLASGEVVLAPAGATLTNAMTFGGGSVTLDLTTIPFLQGETVSISPPQGSSLEAPYQQSISLVAAGGTVFEFTDIQDPIGIEYSHDTVAQAQVASDGNGGTLVTFAACYVAQTRIATPDGSRAVEDLRIGDAVLTASGEHRAVKWIGRRSYARRFLAANPNIRPIRFRAGCFGNGLPRRDLLVSPDHAMFLDGVLIPARCLVNGGTITRERGLDRVDYVHVELDSHDVILAEGAPSETFMDDDSRGLFHNAAEHAALYPNAPAPDGYCAPRIESGLPLERVRRRLAAITQADAIVA